MNVNASLALRATLVAVAAAMATGTADWDWRPSWRSAGDCGVQALFVLMKVGGIDVEVDEIRAIIKLDPRKGCSIEDLRRAASELGMPTEVRFVNTTEFHRIPRPFILHREASVEEGTGHFTVVVDYDETRNRYALVNPVHETFGWYRPENMYNSFTGYVLVPLDAGDASSRWPSSDSLLYLLVGANCCAVWLVLRR